MFRRLWEHWCHMEAILTWTEVSLSDIEQFVECAYASLSAKLYHTSFSFPLPDSWFDTLSHCGFSGQLHTDAMSTACNYFTASPGDVAQKWTGAVAHTALLTARQDHTTWLVTPLLQDTTLCSIVSTAPKLAPPQNTNARFDHSATAYAVSDFCALAARTRSVRGILLLPTSCTQAHKALRELVCATAGTLAPLSSPFGISTANRTARLDMPEDDSMVQFWVYESCEMRAHRPLSATNMVATLGQHLKQVNAKLLSNDTTPLYTPAPAQGKAFVAFAASQARIRGSALNPQCKVQKNLRPKWWSRPNRNWSKVAQSWDEVNRNLHLSPYSWVRKIHQMRKVRPDVLVHREGTWIYILWSTTSELCYIGQTGAKCNARTLHKRGMEHIRCALNYQNIESILQNTKSHLAPRNVYKHVHAPPWPGTFRNHTTAKCLPA